MSSRPNVIHFVFLILIISYPSLIPRLRYRSLLYAKNNIITAFTSCRLQSTETPLDSNDTLFHRRPQQRLVSMSDKSISGDKPGSNIPDYDPNERFKDSSRPPDSHYPPEPDPAPRSRPDPLPTPPPPSSRPSPSSRIPDYDEYARFKDSSRPPDSHYENLNPKRRGRSSCGCQKIFVGLLLWSTFLSLVFYFLMF